MMATTVDSAETVLAGVKARRIVNIVFLDIDGVLNSAARWKVLGAGENRIDPIAVRLVNDLCTRTHAEIVITSTWRTLYPHAELVRLLRRHGLHARVIGQTQDLSQRDGAAWRTVPRGEEIATWLRQHAPCRFVALDDDPLERPAWVVSRLVRTHFNTGLLPEHVERAVALFRQPAMTMEKRHAARR